MTKQREAREGAKPEPLTVPAMQGRKYLKDVLPRLYREAEEWLAVSEWPELVEQLPHLFITERCACGGRECSQFFLDSDLPKLSRELGSKLLLQPLYHDMDSGLMIGLSGAAGLTPGQHTESYVSSFELSCMRGGDYQDRYVHRQLEAYGWPSSPTQED